MNKNYDIIGKTTDRYIVVRGLFRMINQEGIPVTDLLDMCKAVRVMPDWIDFCRDALKCKWSPKTILSRLDPAPFDVYGEKFRDEVIGSLKNMMKYEG